MKMEEAKRLLQTLIDEEISMEGRVQLAFQKLDRETLERLLFQRFTLDLNEVRKDVDSECELFESNCLISTNLRNVKVNVKSSEWMEDVLYAIRYTAEKEEDK